MQWKWNLLECLLSFVYARNFACVLTFLLVKVIYVLVQRSHMKWNLQDDVRPLIRDKFKMHNLLPPDSPHPAPPIRPTLLASNSSHPAPPLRPTLLPPNSPYHRPPLLSQVSEDAEWWRYFRTFLLISPKRRVKLSTGFLLLLFCCYYFLKNLLYGFHSPPYYPSIQSGYSLLQTVTHWWNEKLTWQKLYYRLYYDSVFCGFPCFQFTTFQKFHIFFFWCSDFIVSWFMSLTGIYLLLLSAMKIKNLKKFRDCVS